MSEVVHSYRIIVKIYGQIVEEYSTDIYEEAQEIYYRTAELTTCYTGIYVDGRLLNIPEADDLLDPCGKIRADLHSKYSML